MIAALQARRIDVTEAEYHADPCETPSLSSSLAKVLLAKSPLEAVRAEDAALRAALDALAVRT